MMSDGEVDIRVLALRRQQERRQSRISSGHSAYETTPIKEYSRTESASTRRSSYAERSSPRPIDEDMRIGRMHLPPVIRCECNGIEAFALISSSETVSTISLEFVRKLRILDQIIPETSHVFNPICVQQHEIKGKVKYIDLSIGSWQQVAQFNIVENYISDITLGIDFLRRTQSVMNFEDSALFLGGNKGDRIAFLNSREVMTLARRNTNKTSVLFNGKRNKEHLLHEQQTVHSDEKSFYTVQSLF